MDDLVKQLRTMARQHERARFHGTMVPGTPKPLVRAADHIEARAAVIARLAEALAKIAHGNPTCSTPEGQLLLNQRIAFAALQEL